MKALAAGCGLALGVLLAIIGYSISQTAAVQDYRAPLWAGLVATVTLPLLYPMLVRPVAPWRFALACTVVMILGIALVWMPLVWSVQLREQEGAAVMIWTALWIVAAAPFMRSATKR
ncbi:hypothetical protein P7228_08385 [Altererythrobacter arenosus]|uniref:DUF4175 domain-containing protein n=1 Tax=Altererythrobacter arenosus TaxID=3032592 RepID=A0ABY8FMM7_9SPHN|nr:hypothetical protein [Altererythrobacter sp. CAU 1644]WFL76027.1 hypothetical protein P7228_08385 [Altererythrobacter sp. CAU 1644]